MLFAFPPAVDIDITAAQLRIDSSYINSSSSTLFGDSFPFLSDDESIYYWEKLKSLATDIRIPISKDADSSTWGEHTSDNFDIVSKMTFNKSFKVKAKIKVVSRYEPKIIID